MVKVPVYLGEGALRKGLGFRAEFISPKKVYAFRSQGESSSPKSAKCSFIATTKRGLNNWNRLLGSFPIKLYRDHLLVCIPTPILNSTSTLAK